MSLQLAVILVPVIFGLMGFALDLGRLLLIRGELNQAANASALAAAQQLLGTSGSIDNANTASDTALNDSTGNAPKYNVGSLVIGGSNGLLSSFKADPQYFATAADATNLDSTNTTQADGTTARFVQVNITADAPLLFWGMLSVGKSRMTSIAARAVAGISAPLCTACGTTPIAIAAIDPSEPVDFGFTAATQYTLYFGCTAGGGGGGGGGSTPSLLANTTTLVPYAVLDRNKVSAIDMSQNLYRMGADGLMKTGADLPPINAQSVPAGCIGIGEAAYLWTDPDTALALAPQSCSFTTPPLGVAQLMCGMYTRFDTTVPTSCETNVTNVDSMAASFQPDTDVVDYGDSADYTQYTGNGRRVITVAVVDALATDGSTTMNVLGFRQFLVEPNPSPSDSSVVFNVDDQWGRIPALYIGSIVPVRQGYIGDRFTLGCSITAGPGKVVLHQ